MYCITTINFQQPTLPPPQVVGDGLDSGDCDDIAEQLVMGETGRNLKVGGGHKSTGV